MKRLELLNENGIDTWNESKIIMDNGIQRVEVGEKGFFFENVIFTLHDYVTLHEIKNILKSLAFIKKHGTKNIEYREIINGDIVLFKCDWEEENAFIKDEKKYFYTWQLCKHENIYLKNTEIHA